MGILLKVIAYNESPVPKKVKNVQKTNLPLCFKDDALLLLGTINLLTRKSAQCFSFYKGSNAACIILQVLHLTSAQCFSFYKGSNAACIILQVF